MRVCNCYWCTEDKTHPTRHRHFRRVSDHLLKADSTDPKDSIPVEACITCGHKRVMANGN